MKLKALLQLGLIAFCLILIAIPLSHVLVSQPANADVQAVETTLVTDVAEDVEATDSLSALMAGNMVGAPRRGCSFGIRRPVSAFVP